jgi:hypothetical protein
VISLLVAQPRVSFANQVAWQALLDRLGGKTVRATADPIQIANYMRCAGSTRSSGARLGTQPATPVPYVPDHIRCRRQPA